MPPDIRSFFGGKASAPPIREKEPKKDHDPKKKRTKSRKVIDDTDDDEPTPPPKKAAPKKAAPLKPANDSLNGQETTTSDYFASTSKPKQTKTETSKSKAQPSAELNIRSPALKKTATSYAKYDNDDEGAFLDDDEDAGDDIFAADRKKGGKGNDDYIEIESDDEALPKPTKTISKRKRTTAKKSTDVEMIDINDDDEDDIMALDTEPLPPSKTGKKRKSVDLESDDDDDDAFDEAVRRVMAKKAKADRKPPAKKPRAPTKKADVPESAEIQSILDSIPTVRPPTPPPKDDTKFDWRQAGTGGNAGPPPAAGSKEIPVGEENCLTGLTFVFTGLLETLTRDEGQELVKRYGGKVTGAPSGRTSYVVLGSDAGPSKLRKIQALNIKTINEDGLFELIRRLPANGGDGKAAEINNEKMKAAEEKIRREAEEMEKEERRKAEEAEKADKEAQRQAVLKGSSLRAPVQKTPPTSQLWTSKYAPSSTNQICGNRGQVEKIQNWLKGWQTAHKYNFQKKGPEGLGGYRTIMIHGPPGIGKTTAAHLAAKLSGYDILESNASDTRSKKMVESGLGEVLDNNSLLGYFAAQGKAVDKNKKNIVLIMDEVDGMSAGDRGGVGALAKVCKKTDIPMILICNERKLPKMRPFDHVTLDLPFRRPTTDQVRSRIATICHREGLKLPLNVIDALIEGSNKDIRQIINMISTAKLDQDAMDFDQTKAMSKAWEKHVVLKPWDICQKLLGGGMFAPSSKATLNEKIELYFNDHEFSYLMIQENYLKTKPMLANGASSPRAYNLKALQLAEQAAESISDGDLVDRMIHGSQQQWSLMPTHAVFSTVRPASFISGQLTSTDFTKWLGNNSKTGKLARYIKEIQSHMRLRSSGDRHEIRQQYLPVLWTRLVRRLQVEGKSCVDDVIDLMDSYFLTRDDFDYIMELGLGEHDQEQVVIETQTKATFTRSYNSRSHPLPFMKASNVVVTAKAAKVVPDLEEALEETDDDEVLVEAKEGDDDEGDITKDKYIKQPKAKKASGKKAASKKKAAKKD